MEGGGRLKPPGAPGLPWSMGPLHGLSSSANNDGTLSLINELAVEDYLKGVLAEEMDRTGRGGAQAGRCGALTPEI